MGQAFLSRPVIPALQAEEGDPPTVPPAPPTPPTKRKSKFAGIGKLFKPWKWRKRKSSDTFRETSEVLERKISMRKPKEELIKRGVLIELPEEDTPVTPESPPLRNGHTSQGTSEQLEKDRSLKRSSRQNSLGPRPSSQLETPHERLQELPKQPLLPPKRPLSTSVSTGQDQNGGHKVEQNSTVTRLPSSAPNPAPRTLHPPPTPKQPPVPPPKPQNRNSTPLMMELCQALAGNTLTPVGSRPSPPLPVKRGPPPTTDVITNKERNSSILNPPPPAAANEAPAPSIPSPKLSSQAPSLPPPPPEPPLPVEVPRPGKEEKETPMALPAIPLHIRIQQALNSPQPLPAIDNSQRAHSLLFLPNEVTTAEERTRVRSLPITIELLKVPDDDDEEEEVSIEEESPPEVSDSHAPRVYIGDVTVIPTYLPPSVQEEEEEEEEEDGGMSDSDSEGPILYKEEEEEEDDDDEEQTSSLANKVKRKDTLAMKLGGKISSQEPSNELPHRSREEWTQIRQQIGSQLNRRLSQRPTAEELEQRNILQKNEADRLAEKREIKRRLTRKLSQRPTVAELLERKILRFNEYVEVTDAHDYDRRAEKPWTKLTPADKAAIRKELNDFKSTEMSVHEESKQYTRFHRP